MSTDKLDEVEAREYWERTHRDVASDLEAVCSPGGSARLNRFYDEIQRAEVVTVLDDLGLAVPGDRTLEIGAGRGRWLELFGRRGARASGIDLSAEAVARCRARGLDAQVAPADALPFDAGSFDLVASITVMLHLPPHVQAAAAGEMLRVCRPGGSILLLEGSHPDDSAPHVYARRTADWIELFPGCRVELAEAHYFVPLLRLLARIPREVSRHLEPAIIAVSWPLERALMRMSRRRRTRAGLQVVLVLRKG